MNVQRVMWQGLDAAHTVYKGELSIDHDTYPDLEDELFREIERHPDLVQVYLNVEFNDDSKHLRIYEKRSQTWVRVYADNLSPSWLPFMLFGFLIGMAVVSFIVGLFF